MKEKISYVLKDNLSFFSFTDCGVSSSSEGLSAYLEGFCTIQSVDPRKIEKRIKSLKMSFSKTMSLARERPMLFCTTES
jgi:hypothetical protein